MRFFAAGDCSLVEVATEQYATHSLQCGHEPRRVHRRARKGEYDWITPDPSFMILGRCGIEFDTLLMGRGTYEVALTRFDSLEKMGKKVVVVSTTLEVRTTSWRHFLIPRAISPHRSQRWKAQPGKDSSGSWVEGCCFLQPARRRTCRQCQELAVTYLVLLGRRVLGFALKEFDLPIETRRTQAIPQRHFVASLLGGNRTTQCAAKIRDDRAEDQTA